MDEEGSLESIVLAFAEVTRGGGCGQGELAVAKRIMRVKTNVWNYTNYISVVAI